MALVGVAFGTPDVGTLGSQGEHFSRPGLGPGTVVLGT